MFKEKVELFIIFCKKFPVIPSNSFIPSDVKYITEKQLSTVTFSAKVLQKSFKNLNSGKSYGHDIQKLSKLGNIRKFSI